MFKEISGSDLLLIDGGKSKTFKKIVHNVGDFFGSITKLMGFRIPHIINSAHINEF